MSKSYRKQPFMACNGSHSAKSDKVRAHRGERRTYKRYLYIALINGTLEEFLLPHKLQCPWNEVYSWFRDGKKKYQGLDASDWQRYLESGGVGHFGLWPPTWYQHMMRK